MKLSELKKDEHLFLTEEQKTKKPELDSNKDYCFVVIHKDDYELYKTDKPTNLELKLVNEDEFELYDVIDSTKNFPVVRKIN